MTDALKSSEFGTEVHLCPYCKTAVLVAVAKDGGGVISDPSYDLIADWIYHSSCWDKQVAENPP